MYLLLLLAASPAIGSLRAEAPTRAEVVALEKCAPPCMSSQLLKKVLLKAISIWPEPNVPSYGQLRSGYNHGTTLVVINSHISPNDSYLVTYDGITVCVLLPV
jgi:hypothetical protein